ncbi:MAG: 3,4-dihydroxy-2-butanone-4-phosphate synthase [Nitratireductor sp.]|nr:3,4-dihydroxy-2-butanone-4-phosphate synthase [Nitratireductor sp.]
MAFDQVKVADALRAFEAGEIVVVTDDDDRENEGDLIVAAVHCTSEKMAFIIRHTSGIVCAPMTFADAKRLNLAPMVAENDAPHATAFTVSVDYRHDTTTGISAEERTSTCRALANPNSGAGDFVRPGHIFPLVAKEGGVLMRSGHTEAAVDLCRLSNLPPIGVISELMNEDGTVMRGGEVADFAEKYGLKTISVADLIAYRQRQESLVECIAKQQVQTWGGGAMAHTYKTPWDPMHHLALVFGDIRDGENVPVRLQIESVIDDVFGQDNYLRDTMEHFGKEGRGVLVYLREGSVGVARRDTPHQEGIIGHAEDHDTARSRQDEWLEIGLGAQILRDLGIRSIVLLASRERHYVGLEGFGINILRTDTSQ